MISTQDIQDLLANGGTVVGSRDAEIGRIGQVFLDDQTANPEWVTVKTGAFGGAESFIPLEGASVHGNAIHVPFDKDTIDNAPRVDDGDGHLNREEEVELYSYYGKSYSEPADDDDLAAGTPTGHDISDPTTDDAMTRSEERLHVATHEVEAGRVRLRKFVTTEQVSQTVPVSHEEVRIEREPITDGNRGAASTPVDLSSEEHEIVLSAERVLVDKTVVPVERVRLSTETVTENQTVTEEIRKEQIETDGDIEPLDSSNR